jgi:hypothetical protein
MIRKPLFYKISYPFYKYIQWNFGIGSTRVDGFNNKIGAVIHIAVMGTIGKLAAKGIHISSHKASSHNAANTNASTCTITRCNALAIHNVLEHVLF